MFDFVELGIGENQWSVGFGTMFGPIGFVGPWVSEVAFFSLSRRLVRFDVVAILVVELMTGKLSWIRAGEIDGIYLIEDFFEVERLQGRLIEGEGLLVGSGL